MGVTMYWLIIAVTVILGQVMPQHGRKRIRYIAVMALIHAFVSGFRYMYLTGDLMKYQWNYVDYLNHDYFSEHLLQEGINTGFLWFCKLISTWSDGDFQVFLVVVAVIIEAALAMIVYKYSPIPWISFLAWNCLGFYVFGFSALKQSLAMALVMLAMIAVLENRCVTFVLLTLLAGFVHFVLRGHGCGAGESVPPVPAVCADRRSGPFPGVCIPAGLLDRQGPDQAPNHHLLCGSGAADLYIPDAHR